MAYAGAEQQTFETAVSSSASIVKPTVPKNVLAEFEHFAATGNRFKKSNPFDDDEPVAPPPMQHVRRQAPVPPQQVSMPPVPSFQAPPPAPTRPVDFSQFGDFSVQSARSQQFAPQSQMNEEKAQLINAMQQHLRLKAAYGSAMTVGELSAQIKELTGQSWGGYWEPKYGNLMMFLRSNPDAFTVVKSKYVTCKGQEDVAMRQIERETQEQSALLEEQQRWQAQYSSVPIFAQQPPVQTQTSFYAPTFDDPFGWNNTATDGPQAGEWNGGAQSRSNSLASRRDSSEWALPSAPGNNFSAFDPFAPIDAYRTGEAPSYIPHAGVNTSGIDYWNLPPQPQPRQQPPQHDPFDFSRFTESFVSTGTLNNTSNVLNNSKSSQNDSNNESGLTAEEEDQIRRAERRAARKAKKQEEEDERLARELQSKEFEQGHVPGEGEDSSSGETIVLTTSQMRDLAEKELGIDNVRIIAGFTVKKYGREGRPHQRKMWVTQSLTHLAWASSLLEGSHRGIELRHVTQVTSGQMTPTIARSTSDKNKVRSQCFSLVTMSRTLDMQACSIIQRDALVAALRAVVDFNHKYKPEKVDRDLTKIRCISNAVTFKSS